jgi:hypothetical protein
VLSPIWISFLLVTIIIILALIATAWLK